jgi:hypothetical protein
MRLSDQQKSDIARRIELRLGRERERHRRELSAALHSQREQHARELAALHAELARLQSERSVLQRLIDRWFMRPVPPSSQTQPTLSLENQR